MNSPIAAHRELGSWGGGGDNAEICGLAVKKLSCRAGTSRCYKLLYLVTWHLGAKSRPVALVSR